MTWPQKDRTLLVVAVALIAGLLLLALNHPPAPACPDGACPDGECPLETVETIKRMPVADVPIGAGVGVVLELPPELRTRNWGGGSCVHASNVNLLKWMGQWEMAEWWRNTYSGGEYDSRLVKRLENAGLRYAWIHGGVDRDNDGQDDGEEFMEWAIRTHRGCGIFYKPVHSINLVGLDQEYAYLLDNNATNYPEQYGHYEQVPRKEFLRKWLGFGGFAWTLVYSPTPSKPYVESQR